MAVYTDISADELEALLAGYDLGRLRGFAGIAEGIENSNFRLDTDAGRFVLTVYERRVREAELPYFVELMRWLAVQGFPCPTPQPDGEGRVLQRLRGKPAALVSFLDGASVAEPDAALCAQAGEGLARLHLAARGFPGRRANDLSVGAWRPLVQPRLEQAERLRPGLAASASHDLDALESGWPRDLPQGSIHADLFPDNVFFEGGRFAGAIDFYFACDDALAYDLAVCLNSWAFPAGRFDGQRAGALVGAYAALRPLEPAERAALPLLCRGAAMRFFATRLADWDATPPGALVTPKSPLEYAVKLDHWRSPPDSDDWARA